MAEPIPAPRRPDPPHERGPCLPAPGCRLPPALPALLALALAGCATRAPHATPELSLPAEWRNAPAEAHAAPAAPSATWWRAFGDRQLDALIEAGLAGAPTLEAAAARLDAATAQARAARAARRPALTATAEAGVLRQSLEDPAVAGIAAVPGFDRTQDRWGLGLAARWELDLWGRLAAGERAARADAAVAAAELAGARLTLAAEIADAYLGVREAEAALAAAGARAAALDRLAALGAQRVARGLSARVQLARATGEAALARAALGPLAAEREALLNRIDALIGRPAGSALATLAPAPLPAPPAVATADGPPALIRRRPDLVAAERALVAADARAAQALAERYPRVGLSTLLGLVAGGPGALFGGQALQAGAQLAGSWLLVDGGGRAAGIDAANAASRAALAQYRSAAFAALAEVETALFATARAEARAAELAQSVAALERARAAAQAGWRAGVLSFLDVLDAERQLALAQEGLARAQGARARLAVASIRALGGGWDAAAAPLAAAAALPARADPATPGAPSLAARGAAFQATPAAVPAAGSAPRAAAVAMGGPAPGPAATP